MAFTGKPLKWEQTWMCHRWNWIHSYSIRKYMDNNSTHCKLFIIMALGVVDGIEKANKLPLLVMMIGLAVYIGMSRCSKRIQV